MLGRHARIHLQQHRSLYLTYRTRNHVVITPLAVSRRHLSLSSVTEPLSKAVGSLPDVFQHTIPESILTLSETFVPAGLPTYTTGIFVFAVLTRLCFFTPWSYWARKRKWKLQEEIDPRVIAEFVHGWGPPLRVKLTREKVAPVEVRKIINENLTLRRDELVKEANLGLAPTIIIPALFTLPVFVLATSIMYSTATLPQIAANPALNEMFISLVESGTDIVPALPIAIGVVSLLSLEVGTWGPRSMRSMQQMNTSDAQQAATPSSTVASKPEELELKPSAIATSFFRFLSLVRVPICVALPGTVNIYWFTSTLLGTLEAGAFTLIERSRAPKYWGRSSPLLRLSPVALKARGIDLSTKTPLERAGIKYTPRANKPTVKKEPLSLERAARATFIAGLRASQALKRVPSAMANIRPTSLKAAASWRTLRQHYGSSATKKWNNIRGMKPRDYWTSFGSWRSRLRERSERRWMHMGRWAMRRFQRAQVEDKKRKGELPFKTPTVKWGTKAQRREREKEQNRIRYIMLANASPKSKSQKGTSQVKEVKTIAGLQPPRVRRNPESSRSAGLFA